MTGQDFADRLDALVADLSLPVNTDKDAFVALRSPTNVVTSFRLRNSGGRIAKSDIEALEAFIDGLKPIATQYEVEREAVTDALNDLALERAGHQTLVDADTAARVALQASSAYINSQTARTNLRNALLADSGYQLALAALETAKLQPDYIAAVEAFRINNVSENFGNLGDAKGNYASI